MPVRIKRKNVKYVARVDNPGSGDAKYRYFYTQDAYNAYLKGLHKTAANATKTLKSTPKQSQQALAKKQQTTVEKKGFSLSGLFSGVAKNLQSGFNSVVNTGKNFVNQTVKSLKKTSGNLIDSGKKFVDGLVETKTKISESFVNAGKNFVSKLMTAKEEVSNKITNKAREITNKAKEISDKVVKDVITKVNELPSAVDKIVNKVKEFGTKIYNDDDNIYDINPLNYDEKIEKIKQTDEWKAIVARKDPEYTRYREDGSIEYLIDDYIAKKKHPLVDALGDIAVGRPISVNEISKDTVVAGLKEFVFSKVAFGAAIVAVGTKFLTEKTKLYQGSYEEEVEEMQRKMDLGYEYVKQYNSSESGVSRSDVENVLATLSNGVKNASSSSSSAIDMEAVSAAAKILLDSNQIQSTLKSDEQYSAATSVISNLSEEELAVLATILQNAK